MFLEENKKNYIYFFIFPTALDKICPDSRGSENREVNRRVSMIPKSLPNNRGGYKRRDERYFDFISRPQITEAP